LLLMLMLHRCLVALLVVRQMSRMVLRTLRLRLLLLLARKRTTPAIDQHGSLLLLLLLLLLLQPWVSTRITRLRLLLRLLRLRLRLLLARHHARVARDRGIDLLLLGRCIPGLGGGRLARIARTRRLRRGVRVLLLLLLLLLWRLQLLLRRRMSVSLRWT